MTDFVNITTGGYPQASGSHFWYSPVNAFDGFLDSFWQSSVPCTDLNPVWIRYHWESVSYKIAKYRIFVNETQRPTSWILQSSNDGDDWINLDTQVNQTGEVAEWLEYVIDANQYYNHYRLLISASSDPDLPVRISEIEFRSYLSDITTSTTTSSSSSSTVSSSTSYTSTITTGTTTRSTTYTTGTTFTSTSTTTTEDPTLLWKTQTKLDRVRDQINQWYQTGIPVGIRQLDELPTFNSNYISIPVYIISEKKYYLGTSQGWEVLPLGNVKHGTHHVTEGDDELIHLGLQTPDAEFPGKVWIYADYTISTTTTTSTTTTLTSTSTTLTTTSSTITYTYTTTTLTTTLTTHTTTSTITQSNYTYNVLPGCIVSADSSELGFEANKAIDNLDWTKWLTNSPVNQSNFPHWIKFILSEPKIVYIINVFWDFARYATEWCLEGSNDGFTWDIVYSIDNYLPIPSMYNQHTFYNTKSFIQYRVRFIDGVDSRTSSIGIFSLQLLADAIITTTGSTSTTITSTSSTMTTRTTSTTTTQLGYYNVAQDSIVVGIDEYPYYEASHLIDSNENSYWICDPYVGPPFWVMFYWPHGEEYVVDQYKLFMSSLGRPRNWSLQGSLDGAGWSNLDSQVDEETEGWWESVIPNASSYKYYRLLISQTQSVGYAVRLGAVELWTHQEYRTSTTTESTSTATTFTTITTTISSTLTTMSTTSASTTYPIPSELTLLLNFNGANLSTQESDDTLRHHGITWVNDTSIVTIDKKYGTGSLNLPYPAYYPSSLADTSYLILPNSYDWQLGVGTGDLTIDFWIKWKSDDNLSRNWNNIVTYIQDLNNYWSVRYYPDGHLLGFVLRVNGSLEINYNVMCSMIPHQWNYVCLVRLGNNFKFFLNGSDCDDGEIYDIVFPYFEMGNLWVGYGPSEYLNTMLDFTQANCNLDALRISVGSLFNAPHELPPEPPTSSTVSTTTVTTTTAIANYYPRLTITCDDGESYLYDYTNRHGIISLTESGTLFANRFAIYTDQFITPKFGAYLLSCYTSPYDYRSSTVGYVQVADHPDWRLGDNGIDNFTVEAWIAYRVPFYQYGSPILSHYQDSNNFWCIYVNYTNNKFYFKVREEGNFIIDYNATIRYSSLHWNYFSLNRINGRIRVFWGGEINGFWENHSQNVIPNFSGPLYLFGGPSLTDYSQIESGGIACSGLRITKGIYPGSNLGVIPMVAF